MPAQPAPRDESPAVAGRGPWAELLRNRRFLLMEASGTLSGAGYAVYSVSVLYLAYARTDNLLLAGVVLFIETGVYTLTFLVAPLVDRAANKRSVLLVCFPIQAAAAALLGGGLRTGHLSTPLLLGLVLLLAFLWDFVWAVYVVAPRLVVPPRLLFAADGFGSALSVGSQIGGYAGGGALLFLVGPAGGAFAYFVLLALAAAVSLPLSLPSPVEQRAPFGRMFLDGWSAFRGRAGRALRRFSALETFYGFAIALPVLIAPAIAFQRFAAPAAAYGTLVTVYALGGSLGGLAIGRLNPRGAVGRVLVIAPLGAAGCLALLVVAPSELAVVAALLGGVGAAASVRYTAKYTWLRAAFPPEQLGRIGSNMYLFTGAAGAVASLTIGLLSTHLTLAAIELTDAVALAAAGAIAFGMPFVRSLAF